MNNGISTTAPLHAPVSRDRLTVTAFQLALAALLGVGVGLLAAAALLGTDASLSPAPQLLLPNGLGALVLAVLLIPEIRARKDGALDWRQRLILAFVAGLLAIGAALPPVLWNFRAQNQILAQDVQSLTILWTLGDNGVSCSARLAATDAWQPDTFAGAVGKEALYRDMFSTRGGNCLSAEGLFERMPALVAVGEADLRRNGWRIGQPAPAATRIGVSAFEWCMAVRSSLDVRARVEACGDEDTEARLSAPPASYIKAEA